MRSWFKLLRARDAGLEATRGPLLENLETRRLLSTAAPDVGLPPAADATADASAGDSAAAANRGLRGEYRGDVRINRRLRSRVDAGDNALLSNRARGGIRVEGSAADGSAVSGTVSLGGLGEFAFDGAVKGRRVTLTLQGEQDNGDGTTTASEALDGALVKGRLRKGGDKFAGRLRDADGRRLGRFLPSFRLGALRANTDPVAGAGAAADDGTGVGSETGNGTAGNGAGSGADNGNGASDNSARDATALRDVTGTFTGQLRLNDPSDSPSGSRTQQLTLDIETQSGQGAVRQVTGTLSGPEFGNTAFVGEYEIVHHKGQPRHHLWLNFTGDRTGLFDGHFPDPDVPRVIGGLRDAQNERLGKFELTGSFDDERVGDGTGGDGTGNGDGTGGDGTGGDGTITPTPDIPDRPGVPDPIVPIGDGDGDGDDDGDGTITPTPDIPDRPGIPDPIVPIDGGDDGSDDDGDDGDGTIVPTPDIPDRPGIPDPIVPIGGDDSDEDDDDGSDGDGGIVPTPDIPDRPGIPDPIV